MYSHLYRSLHHHLMIPAVDVQFTPFRSRQQPQASYQCRVMHSYFAVLI
jgi:hypothetical protein